MPNYSIELSKLAQQIRGTITNTDIRLGYTGKISATDTINPDPSEGLDQGFVWVRFDNNGEAIKARCHKVSARLPNMPVRVGKDTITKEWVVLEVVPTDAINDLASTFSVPDRNDDLIYERFDANRFRYLHVIPGTDTFDVEVEPGYYWFQGEFRGFTGGTVNIASSIPTGGYGGSKRGVLIGIDPADDSVITFDGESIGILETPGNGGKYFTETYIAETVNAADLDIYWIALIPLTSEDSNWRDLYRVTALQLTGGNGSAISAGTVRVTSADTTPDYLYNKLAAGNGITLAVVNPAADEDLSITVNQSQLSLANLGTRNFINLSDVPSSYSGQALKALRVNSGATGLEFHDYDADYVNVTGDTMTGGLVINSTAPSLSTTTAYTATASDATTANAVFGAIGVNQAGFTMSADPAIAGLRGGASVLGATGTVAGAAGVYGSVTKLFGGALTNAYSIYAGTNTRSAGTLTNNYGVYIESQSAGTNNYGIYTNAGLNVLNDQLSIVGRADRIQSIVKAYSSQTVNTAEWQTSGGTAFVSISNLGRVTIAPVATTGTPGSGLTFTAAAHTALNAAEYIDVNYNLNRTVQYTTGSTIPTQRAYYIQAPTYSATSATQTITDAVTFEISGAPSTSGGNIALTNKYALRVASGISRFNDAVQIVGSVNGNTQFLVKGASSQSVDIWNVQAGDGTVVLRTGKGGGWFITAKADTGGPEAVYGVTGAAHTALNDGSEYSVIRFNMGQTLQWTKGASALTATQRMIRIDAPTLDATAGTYTFTNAATFAISAAPSATANVSITNAWALWVQSGKSKFAGNVNLSAVNIETDTSTGTKIGTGTTQKIGFFNATPVVQLSAYTITNDTTDRSYDANATTLDELADVVATLYRDLKSIGLFA